MAPDVTWYVSGTTKCLAHGLRIGHLVGPSSGEVERLFAAVNRLSYWFPSPLSAVILRNWIDNGSAQRIREAIIAESVARQQLAAGKLGNLGLVTRYGSFHGWLKLSPELDRHDFVRALANRGVRVREAELFAVEEGPVPNAIRISLSSADTIEDLAEGLDIIGDELMCGAEIERG
jgi:DNA-binding transcriptional MocR family regulator